jgi:hypothetical protein
MSPQLATQQMGPARLALAGCPRQLHHLDGRLAGQFVEEALHRRDVGKAVQAFAVQAQLGGGLRAPQHQHGQQRHRCARHAQHAAEVVLVALTRLPLASNTRLQALRPSIAAAPRRRWPP